MNGCSATAIHLRRRSRAERLELLRTVCTKLAFSALIVVCALQLGGCRAVEAIFKVGVWFGVLIVVAIIAVLGGGAALIMRKR